MHHLNKAFGFRKVTKISILGALVWKFYATFKLIITFNIIADYR